MSNSTPNLNLFKYDVSTDANVPFSITEALNNNWDIIDEKCTGGGLEICDIGMALYIDETKGLRRYLNGQVVNRNTNTEAFFTRLQKITTLHPSLLDTEENWQAAKALSPFGQVGKFVFNYSGENIVSVRLPRVVNVQGLFDLQNLGMTVSAGLPNIEAEMIGTGALGVYGGVGVSGAFTNNRTSARSVGLVSGGAILNMFDFDASKSNPIYGNSNTVQQEAIQYPYFIQIAIGSETENNIVNEIELNNPYSLFDSKYSDLELNNLSWLKSSGQWNAKAVYPTAYDKLLKVQNGTEAVEGLSVKLSTETYTDYDFVLNTANTTFRLPLKTKLASGKAVVGNGMTLGLNDGTNNFGLRNINNYCSGFKSIYGTSIGTSASTSSDVVNNVSVGVTTDPTKSGIELSDSNLYLYFYVGETVQNANLIDAGRIGEQVASLIPDNSNLITSYCCPDWNNGITAETSLKVEQTFVAPSDGIISYSLSAFNVGNAYIKVNEITILQSMASNNPDFNSLTGTMIVSGGDVVKYYSSYIGTSYNSQNITFFPMKGAN